MLILSVWNPEQLFLFRTKKERKYQFLKDYKPLEIKRMPHKRGISLAVKPNGVLKIITNKTHKNPQIYQLVKLHHNWIVHQRKKYSEHRKHFPLKKFQSGELFPIYGVYYQLTFEETLQRKNIDFYKDDSSKTIFCSLKRDHFLKEGKNIIPRLDILKKMQSFYKSEAERYCNERIRYFSEQMGLYPSRVIYHAPKSRWGSCHTDGTIKINYKILCFDRSLIDYILIHELAHLKYMNHSKVFWSLVEKHCPDYKIRKRKINELQYNCDFLNTQSELHLESNSYQFGEVHISKTKTS